MNIIEALRRNKPLRRPISKHLGSNGDGWLGAEFVINELLYPNRLALDQYYDRPVFICRLDLLADDWEVLDN